MALTYSKQIDLGTTAEDFSLPAVDGRVYSLKDFASAKALVVMFICNHCPYVQAVEERILQLVHEYSGRGVQFIGICANDPTDYPDDSFDNLRKRWTEKQYGFPYLVDESQEVARNFGAVCTPDIFVYDNERKLAYRGRIDDNWQRPEAVTRRELAAALDALLSGKRPSEEQHPSMGCSIKWRTS
ncbi:MAG: thioredoxin family protein [Acidobacteriota bacterium]